MHTEYIVIPLPKYGKEKPGGSASTPVPTSSASTGIVIGPSRSGTIVRSLQLAAMRLKEYAVRVTDTAYVPEVVPAGALTANTYVLGAVVSFCTVTRSGPTPCVASAAATHEVEPQPSKRRR